MSAMIQLPAAQAEMWRRFPITPLREQSFVPVQVVQVSEQVDDTVADLPSWLQDAGAIVRMNNGYCQSFPTLSGVSCREMDAAARSSLAQRAQVRSADRLVETNLGAATAAKGIVIDIDADLAKPIVIVHALTQVGAVNTPAVEINMATGVEATIIEWFTGGEQALGLPLTHVTVADQATLHYHRWHDCAADAALLGTLSATVGEQAKLNANCFNTSGKIVRLDAEVSVAGERSDVALNGLSLVAPGEQVGLVYRVNHPEPNSVSNQNVRVVIDGKGKHLYDGYIYVGHGANGTDAAQHSKSMLLSPLGQAHANPRLEIHTDDVSCAHGATVGFLDADALFYLESRGIPAAQAQAMLIEGFTQAALTSVNYAGLADALTQLIQQRFHQAS